MSKWLTHVGAIRNYLSFILTLISVLGVLLAHFMLGTEIEILLPAILGLYLGTRTFNKAGEYKAATNDEKADTKAIIESVDDR